MKKIIILLIAFVCLSPVFGLTLIDTAELKDDWGDPTGDSFVVIVSDDFTYSSKYLSSRTGYAFYLLYYPSLNMVAGSAITSEYLTYSETFFDKTISVKYRNEKKTVVEKKTNSELNENATFCFLGQDAQDFIDFMKESSVLQLIVSGTDYEKDTKYNVTFEYDTRELIEAINSVENHVFDKDPVILNSFSKTFGIDYNSSYSKYQVADGTPNLWDYGNNTPEGWKLLSVRPLLKCGDFFDEYGIAVTDGKVKAIVAQKRVSNIDNPTRAYEEICSYINEAFGESSFTATSGIWYLPDKSDWKQINLVKTNTWITLVIQSYDFISRK